MTFGSVMLHYGAKDNKMALMDSVLALLLYEYDAKDNKLLSKVSCIDGLFVRTLVHACMAILR